MAIENIYQIKIYISNINNNNIMKIKNYIKVIDKLRQIFPNFYSDDLTKLKDV